MNETTLPAEPDYLQPTLEDTGSNWRTNLRTIAGAGFEDIKSADRRLSTTAALGGVATVEAIGLAKLPTAVSASFALEAAQVTGSPVLAAAATGALYTAWGFAATRTLSNGMSKFPNTMDSLATELPGQESLVKAFPVLNKERSYRNTAHRVGSAASDGAKAFVCMGPQMYGAGVLGHSPAERNKVGTKLAVGAGAYATLLAGLETGGVAALHEVSPTTARAVENTVEEPLNLVAGLLLITAVSIGTKRAVRHTKNKLQARRERLDRA